MSTVRITGFVPKRIVAALLTVIAVSLGLLGCTPRGETKSLNEILQIAQKDFAAQVPNAGEVKDRIAALQASLELLVSEQSDRGVVTKSAADLALNLAVLIERAGYTSRPSLTELVHQYREIEADAGRGEAQLNRLKLIATRTYSAVASELATTRFTVLPLAESPLVSPKV